jgi:polysaccharide biosynthesis transport protein
MLETRIAALESLVEEQRAARAARRRRRGGPPMTELDLELAPIDARLEFIAQERALIEETLAALEASIQATPANEMVLAGMERELGTCRPSTRRVAASGQAAVGERIEVTARGERFSLIEPPTEPGRAGAAQPVLIAGAGVVGGARPRLRLRGAARAAEPLDPPAGGAQRQARHPALRDRSPTSAPGSETRWKRAP